MNYKKISIILLSFFGLLALGCSDDELNGPTLNLEEISVPQHSFSNNISGQTFILVAENENELFTEVSWPALQIPLNVVGEVRYDIQIDEAGDDFSDPTTVLTTSSTNTSFTIGELNNKLIEHEVATETDIQISVRLRSYVVNTALEFFSDPTTFTVNAYPACAVPGFSIGIIGNATPTGWDSDTNMISDCNNPNLWRIQMLLQGGLFVKFRQDDAWDTNWGSGDFPTGTGTQNGPDIPVAETALYNVTFNSSTGDYSFEVVEVKDYVSVSLSGSAAPGGSFALTQNANDSHSWSGTVDLVAGDVNLVGEETGGATTTWGGTELASGEAVIDGPAWTIPADATYLVSFNDITAAYSFTELSGISVTFTVVVPAHTPSEQGVFMAGAFSSIGISSADWEEPGTNPDLQLTDNGDGTFSKTFEITSNFDGVSFEYKYFLATTDATGWGNGEGKFNADGTASGVGNRSKTITGPTEFLINDEVTTWEGTTVAEPMMRWHVTTPSVPTGESVFVAGDIKYAGIVWPQPGTDDRLMMYGVDGAANEYELYLPVTSGETVEYKYFIASKANPRWDGGEQQLNGDGSDCEGAPNRTFPFDGTAGPVDEVFSWEGYCPVGMVALTFKVTVPSNTPTDQGVFLAGQLNLLGIADAEWQQPGTNPDLELTNNGDGTYSKTFMVDFTLVGTSFNYKYFLATTDNARWNGGEQKFTADGCEGAPDRSATFTDAGQEIAGFVTTWEGVCTEDPIMAFNVTVPETLVDGVSIYETHDVYVAGDIKWEGLSWPQPGTDPRLKLSKVDGTDFNYVLYLPVPTGQDIMYKYFLVPMSGGATWDIGEQVDDGAGGCSGDGTDRPFNFDGTNSPTDTVYGWAGYCPPDTGGAKISDFRALFNGTDAVTLEAGASITATVIMSTENGNQNGQNAVIQDGTAGIVVRFAENHTLAVGDNITIDLSGQELSAFNGLLQFNNIPLANLTVNSSGTALPAAKAVSIADMLTDAYESQLVELTNVSFVEADGTATYSGGKTLTDGTDQITVFTRSQASFSGDVLPSGNLKVIGVGGDFNGVQLLIRQTSDISSFTPGYATIGLVGGGTEIGSWDIDVNMTQDANDIHTWTLTNVKVNGEVKFRPNDTWDEGDWGGTFPDTPGTGNIVVPEGYYNITFNSQTGAFTFTDVTANLPVAQTAIALVGSGTPQGWPTDTSDDAADFTQDGTDPHIWRLASITLTDGEVKFRADNAWATSWGNSTFPQGFGSTDNGPNIPSVAGDYEVYFNDASGFYYFKPASGN